jgi:hypothetical protein
MSDSILTRPQEVDRVVLAIVKWAYDRGCRDALQYGPRVASQTWKHSSIPPLPEALTETLKDLLNDPPST